MKKLKNTVQQFIDANNFVTLGGKTKRKGKKESLPAIDKRQILQQELQKLSKRNNVFFGFCIFLGLSIFILTVIYVITHLDSPEKMQIVFGASGVSISGIIWYMHQLWKEKNTSDVLITLLGVLEGDQLITVLTLLVTKV